eukprot:m.331487 g.331487  ORF g.331487 m.331487 type:complete len:744 (+) comp16740_c0_seq1:82-2313(+)
MGRVNGMKAIFLLKAWLLLACFTTENAAEIRLGTIRPAENPKEINEFGVFTIVPDEPFRMILEGNFSKDDKVFFTDSNAVCDNRKHPDVRGGFDITPIVAVAENNYFTSGSVEVDVADRFSGNLVYVCLGSEHQGNGTFNNPYVSTFLTESEGGALLPTAASALLVAVLLILSGLFSGLNLGLMSLDATELEIYLKSGTPSEQKYAKKILPLRKRGNLLLCTLLLGNVLVNSLAVILLETLVGGLIALFVSTLGIVIFGEIVPQSICSRHGLKVGAHTTPITVFFMILTFPVAWPVSKLLDCLLGEELGSVFQRKELLQLVQLTDKANDLDKDELDIVTGALTYSDKIVEEVMTPISDVFSLPMNSILDYQTISRIVESGHSRIPVTVQVGMRFEIKAVVFVKDMAFVDPDDCMPLETLIKFYKHEVLEVLHDTRLDDLLDLFKQQRTHMAAVQRIRSKDDYDPEYELVGIVTLEDVIEEIIGSEIHDETDRVTDNLTKKPLSPVIQKKSMGDEKSIAESLGSEGKKKISEHIVMAAYTYLSDNVEAFHDDRITKHVLYTLLTRKNPSCIIVIPEGSPEATRTLYQNGQDTKLFTLVLEGHVDIISTNDSLPTNVEGLYPLCEETLKTDKAYTPDFTAICAEDARTVLFQVTRTAYKEAVRGTKLNQMGVQKEPTRTVYSKPLKGNKPEPTQVQRVKAALEWESNLTGSKTPSETSETSKTDEIPDTKEEGSSKGELGQTSEV